YLRKPFLLVGFLPLMLIASLRGYVGTDTSTYVQLIDDNLKNKGGYEFEPGFDLLSGFLAYITNDAFLVVLIISAIISMVLIVSFVLLDRQGVLFSFCVIPLFYFQMSMNGLRYGLAFATVVLAYSFYCKGKK